MPNYHSLSRRIILQFCVFTLVLSTVYSFISFIMMYTIEDSFIERDVRREAQYFSDYHKKYDTWPAPRTDYIQLHFSKDTFNDDIRALSILEPARKEFYGSENRHYHVLTIDGYENTYVVAEVSDLLHVRPIRNNLLTFLSISAAVVTFIACLIAWLIGRKTAAPLTRLADLVGGAAPEHIPKKFAGNYPKNEVGVLAHTLEQSFERISQALERERCFTRDVSHELRTPLAIIKNATELQLNDPQISSAKQASLRRIANATEQMDKTVHTLLMLAREEHTKALKENVNLISVIEQSVLDHRTLLNNKDIHVVIDNSCDVNIFAQSGMLKVMLDNLISNAFQYTHKGEVKLTFENGQLSIIDTGTGIESEIYDQITNPAVKGSQSTGFGFGLSIVKRLCEHQDWQMQVLSQHGTTVIVKFEKS